MKPDQPKGQPTPPAGAATRQSGSEPVAAIGRQLREMYDRVLTEPVPEHLVKLVERLDEGEDDEGK